MLYPFMTIDFEKRILSFYKNQPLIDQFYQNVEVEAIDKSLRIKAEFVVRWRDGSYAWHFGDPPEIDPSAYPHLTEKSFRNHTTKPIYKTSFFGKQKEIAPSRTYKTFGYWVYFKEPAIINRIIELQYGCFTIIYNGFDKGEV